MKQTAVEWLVEQICGDHTSEWQEQIKERIEVARIYAEALFNIL